MIQGKVKSLHENIKQKNLKLKNFNSSKGWFDKFRKRFGFRNVNITGKAASANQEAADELPDGMKNISEEKRVSAWTGFYCR